MLSTLVKSNSTFASDLLFRLCDNEFIDNEIVLLLDLIYLRPQVQFSSTALVECNQDSKCANVFSLSWC